MASMALPKDVTLQKIVELYKERGVVVTAVDGLPIAKGDPEVLENIRAELGLQNEPFYSIFSCNPARASEKLRQNGME